MSADALRIRLLGPVEVLRGDRPVKVGGVKPRVLLALLALRAGRVVPVDTLVGALWGDDPPEKALGTLQAHVSALRRALDVGDGPSVVVNRAPGYLLDVPPDAVDITEFRELAARGRELAAGGRPSEAATVLGRADELWRGTALADVASELALIGPAGGLDDERLAVREQRLAADLQRGAHLEVIGELQAMTGEHPLHEELWGLLMLALYRSGRQADALAAYRTARETLVEELGIEPGRALQDLETAVLAQSADLDVDAARTGQETSTFDTTIIGSRVRGPEAHLVGADGARVSIGGRCLIGRHPDCTVTVDDPQVSRRHAVIRAVPDGHEISDLDSTNGTFVNGEPVAERVLQDGDLIVIGDADLRYELEA